jgi:hypothetical protein
VPPPPPLPPLSLPLFSNPPSASTPPHPTPPRPGHPDHHPYLYASHRHLHRLFLRRPQGHRWPRGVRRRRHRPRGARQGAGRGKRGQGGAGAGAAGGLGPVERGGAAGCTRSARPRPRQRLERRPTSRGPPAPPRAARPPPPPPPRPPPPQALDAIAKMLESEGTGEKGAARSSQDTLGNLSAYLTLQRWAGGGGGEGAGGVQTEVKRRGGGRGGRTGATAGGVARSCAHARAAPGRTRPPRAAGPRRRASTRPRSA